MYVFVYFKFKFHIVLISSAQIQEDHLRAKPGVPNLFCYCSRIKFCCDLATPTVCKQELTYKDLERNWKFLDVEKFKHMDNKGWHWLTFDYTLQKNIHLLEICTKYERQCTRLLSSTIDSPPNYFLRMMKNGIHSYIHYAQTRGGSSQ